MCPVYKRKRPAGLRRPGRVGRTAVAVSLLQGAHERDLVAVRIGDAERTHAPAIHRLMVQRAAARLDGRGVGIDVRARRDVQPNALPLLAVSYTHLTLP